MFTLKDIASMTNMTPRTIQNYLAKGLLKGIKVGGQWRFTEEQVQSFYNQGAVADTLKEAQDSRLNAQVERHIIPENRLSTLTAIWDVKIDDDKPLKLLVDQLTSVIREEIESGLDNFSFNYNDQQKLARFTFIGELETIKRLLEVLQ